MEHKLIQGLALILMIPALYAMLVIVTTAIPNVTARIGETLRRRCLLSILIGILLFAICAAAARFAPKIGQFLAVPFILLILVGLPSAIENLGRRIHALRAVEPSRFSALTLGWFIYAFAALVPFVGWFVILPLLPLAAVGSTIVALFTTPSAGSSGNRE